MERLTYTPREVGQLLGLSERAVRDMLDRGELPELPRFTKKRLVPKAAVDALIAEAMKDFDAGATIAAIAAGRDAAA